MQSLQSGQILGRYRVDAVLGSGGIADVYLVTHVDLHVQRAVKVLKRTGGDLVPRLVREGRLQAQVQHPNIVPVLEMIDVDGHPALVMDYVDGPSLDALLDPPQLGIEHVDVIARHVFDAVIAAHARGLVHRDLKPSNVLLDLRRDPPLARVTDFGLAKVADEPSAGMTSTASGVVMGTPRYMAPEQFRDAKRVDQQADVWALGALLYELLTGTAAFPATSLAEAVHMVESGRTTPIHDLAADVPARMVWAIEEALIPDAAARLPTVQAMRDLWCDGAPTLPAPHWDHDALRVEPKPLPGAATTAAPVATVDIPVPATTVTWEPDETGVSGRGPSARWVVALGVAGAGVLAAVVAFAGPWWADADPTEVAQPAALSTPTEPDEATPDPPVGPEPTAAAAAGAPNDRGTAPDPSAAPDPGPSDVRPEASPSRPAPTAALDPAPALGQPVAVEARPEPAVEDEPAVAEPSVDPPEPPPAPGTWVNRSRGVAVKLRGSDGADHSPGPIIPGSYRIVPAFDPDYTGLVEVPAGARVVVRCGALTARCDAEVEP